MNIKFLGVSGHLASGASGHFESFHKGLFLAVKGLLGEEQCSFLGSQKSKEKNCWYAAKLPSSLTSTIPWLSRSFLDSYLTPEEKTNDFNIIYVYEGNLGNLFLFASMIRRSKNTFLYFNLFNANRYKPIFRSNFRLLLFKSIFFLFIRGIHSQIYLTADTKRFAEQLSRRLGKKFYEFPIYSALNFQLELSNVRKKVLINFRGQSSEKLFRLMIDSSPVLLGIEFDLHGLHDKSIAQYLSSFSNMTILPNQVEESTYFSSYNQYYRAAFIYDPELFAIQSSGRIADATVAGVQLVVPRDTSLEDFLDEHGNGSTFSFIDCESLATALISEPAIPKLTSQLPTSTNSAQSILNSIKGLIKGSRETFDKPLLKALNIAFDECIRILFWCLRIVFGLRNRFLKILKQKS